MAVSKKSYTDKVVPLRPEQGVTPLEDGGVEVTLGPDPEPPVKNSKSSHYDNLVEGLDDEVLTEIGAKVVQWVEDDKQSRADWENLLTRGLDELGLKLEDTDEPFEGACTAVHPLLLENIVKFQSKAIQELFPAGGPVKTQIVGEQSPDRLAQARRVREHMNYQLTEEMVEYFDEMERMLFSLAFVGSAFKKMYFDAALGRPVCELVPISDFIVSYQAPDLRRAERYTHVLRRYQHELEQDIRNGVYLDPGELLEPMQQSQSEFEFKQDEVVGLKPSDSWRVHTLLECHCSWDIPGHEEAGGAHVPYIITVDRETRKVLSIRRNWAEGDKKFLKREWFVHYRYVPGFGFYGFGLTHLIGSLAKTATTTLRALVDSGMFATLQGGFKAKGLRILGDNEPIAPGEWRDVEAAGLDITKSLVPLPYKEPSQVLFALYQDVVGAGQKFADSTDQVISDSTNYGPVGTTLALLEASTKFFSAIHKRSHASLRQEFRMLARINKESLPPRYPYAVAGQPREIMQSDYDDRVDILPVSDPNTPSNSHRLTRATTLMQLDQANPGVLNKKEVVLFTLDAMGVDEAIVQRMVPNPAQAQPADPITDIQSASEGKPIKAFPGQDHDGHIGVKMAFLQSLEAQKDAAVTAGSLPQALAANVKEHLVLKFAERTMAAAQKAMQEQGLPPEQALAGAAQQVAQIDLAMAQQAAQNMAQTDDASVALGYAELQQRMKEHLDKMIHNAALLAVRNRDLDIKEMQAAADMHVAGQENAQEQQKAQAEFHVEGAKLGLEKEKVQVQREQAEAQQEAQAIDQVANLASMTTQALAAQAEQRDREDERGLKRELADKQMGISMATKAAEHESKAQERAETQKHDAKKQKAELGQRDKEFKKQHSLERKKTKTQAELEREKLKTTEKMAKLKAFQPSVPGKKSAKQKR